LKEALEGEKFNDDAAVEQFVRNWFMKRLTTFFQGGDQEVSYPVEEMHFCEKKLWVLSIW